MWEVLGIYLSEHYDFQNTLEEMLRDRLVCGINDEQIQRRSLAESSLHFKKAMKLETAAKNARDLTPKMASGGDTLTYTSGTISLALIDELFKSWYSHYFLNTYITNLLQNYKE